VIVESLIIVLSLSERERERESCESGGSVKMARFRRKKVPVRGSERYYRECCRERFSGREFKREAQFITQRERERERVSKVSASQRFRA